MKLHTAHPSGWALFESALYRDERGWLTEALRIDVLQAHAGRVSIAQQNLSHSRRGVLRGLHYQLGAPQGKLVQVLHGSVRDVIVDLRRGAPGFASFFAFELCAGQAIALWVPPGFAHGFLAREDSLLSYSMTHLRVPQAERSMRWDSPALAIDWRLDGTTPILSQRDREAPLFGAAEVFETP